MIRGKYQGIIGGFNSLGFAVGPIIGGALAQKVGWRVRSYTGPSRMRVVYPTSHMGTILSCLIVQNFV